MSAKKQIEIAEWRDRLQLFVSGNKGRAVAIAAEGMTIVENKSLVSVDYDPKGKGNDIMIDLEGFAHAVNTPVELYLTEESIGVISTMEIIDQNGSSNLMRLL